MSESSIKIRFGELRSPGVIKTQTLRSPAPVNTVLWSVYSRTSAGSTLVPSHGSSGTAGILAIERLGPVRIRYWRGFSGSATVVNRTVTLAFAKGPTGATDGGLIANR